MIQNKITIEGQEFELEEVEVCPNMGIILPSIYFKGKRYIGKAIPNKPGIDYDVIKLSTNNNFGSAVYTTYEESGCSYTNKDTWLNYFLTSTAHWRIHSVKRLSDNEVFTLGDKLQTKLTVSDNSIKSIEIVGDTVWLCGEENNWSMCIKNGKKAVERIPLFYADGGETPIYEGDKYWHVNTNFHITEFIAYVGSYGKDMISSLEKANEYVLMNKPCLSINDIITGNHILPLAETFILKLKELAKEKLNK